MQCPSCESDNPQGAKFCDVCGIRLPAGCPACGAVNRSGAKFCGTCGAALAPQANPAGAETPSPQAAPAPVSGPSVSIGAAVETQRVPDSERKQVTALFVDIMGSTALGRDLDPEEARAIIDPALSLMIDSARRYDGYVVQSTGDGIFALFGAPMAHEDHPQRALYAAMRMHEEIRRYGNRLRAEGRPPIQIRAGANTGEVVVRTIETGTAHTEYTPIGHTVNLASRLQSLASGGGTVISDSTRKFVEGYFALRRLGPAHVKGIDEPINVHEVVGLGPLRTRLERSAGRGLSKFVGRSQEKEMLRRAAETARSGAGQIVAVVAEPGVGKSRLFFEFNAEAQSDWTVLEAFSVSHGKGSSYVPIVELLHSYFDISPDDDAVVRREKVANRVTELDPEFEASLPYLYALLEIADDKERLAGMDAQLRKARTLDAIARLLLKESERRPLILMIEDLHWLDDESQALLDLVADQIAEAKFLLLVNYRPEYAQRWTDKSWYHSIRLDSLGGDSAEEMLSAMLGDEADLAPLKALIVKTTGGVPFFMEEVVQALLDEGAIERANGRAHLVKPLDSLRIPPTVQAILAARIDRLRNDEKNLLQTLAVLGREFVLSLARAVADKSEDELERLIARLQLGEFVYEQPSIADVEYIFKHALTQEVAYNSVLLERRKQLHEHVGNAIETIYTASLDDHLPELAHHYSRSGNNGKAVEYLQLAGQQAMSRGALTQAVRDLQNALDLLKAFPAGPDRDALELKLLNPLGTAYIAQRGYAAPEVRPVFVRARELCERIAEPAQLFSMVFGNFAWHVVRGEMGSTMTLANEAMELAERFDDPGMLMEALFLMGVTLYYRGDFVQALAQYEKALSHYDDRERNRAWASIVGEDAGVAHRCYLSLALWHLGFPEQALRASREAVKLAQSIDHPFSHAYAQHHASWLCHNLRLPAETKTSGEEGTRTAADHGFALFRATGVIAQGGALLLEGRPRDALTVLVRGLDAYRATGAGLSLPYYMSLLGEALMGAGRLDDARQAFDEGLAIVERHHELCQRAELYRLKGELALLTDPPAYGEAEVLFAEAIATAKRQRSTAWELRATTSLAGLYRQTDRRQEAHDALSGIYNRFTEGFDKPDLVAARALLDELAA
jgi:class 3 adenylate cyclase/predicted ATPase